MRRLRQLPRRLPHGGHLTELERGIRRRPGRVRGVLHLLQGAERRGVRRIPRGGSARVPLRLPTPVHGPSGRLPHGRPGAPRARVPQEPPGRLQRPHSGPQRDRGWRTGHRGDQDQRRHRPPRPRGGGDRRGAGPPRNRRPLQGRRDGGHGPGPPRGRVRALQPGDPAHGGRKDREDETGGPRREGPLSDHRGQDQAGEDPRVPQRPPGRPGRDRHRLQRRRRLQMPPRRLRPPPEMGRGGRLHSLPQREDQPRAGSTPLPGG